MKHSPKEIINNMSIDEVTIMLRREYLRKLTEYKLIDEFMRKKYKMPFEEFEQKNIVSQKGYSWEVESEAQEWEMAIDGIKTYFRKLGEINLEH